jgi:formate transporter
MPYNHEKVFQYDPALSTEELAKKFSELGIKKANTEIWELLILGVLAGLYIGFGSHLYLVSLDLGMGRVVGGAVFGVGLVLVVVAGAELFTGNILMIIGSLLSLFSPAKILRNWITVYVGNFAGSVLFAYLIWKSGLLGAPENLTGVGMAAVKAAAAKIDLSFLQAFIRGVFCNMLVVLAIIMATISKDVISKIFCCVLPIMAFVACGFEHCVANMTIISMGLFANGTAGTNFFSMFHNLIPVTLGNIVGGILIVVGHPKRIRQFVYLVRQRKTIKSK